MSREDLAVWSALAAAAASFYLAPVAWLWLPAFALFAVIGWHRPDLALLIVVLFAPLFMLPKPISSHHFPPAELLLAAGVVAAALRVLPDRTSRTNALERVRATPFVAPGALLLAGTIVAAALAADRHDAADWALQMVLEPFLFYIALVATARRNTPFLLVGTVVAMGAYLSVLGIGQAFGIHNPSSSVGTISKAQAVYGSPDNLGLVLDRTIPLCLAFLLLGPSGRWVRLVWTCTGIVMAAALLLSYSRGAWAAVGAACLLLCLSVSRWGKWIVILAVLAVLGAVSLEGPALAHALSSGHAGTVHRRIDIWRSSLHMIRDHALIGIGPDNFQHYYAPTHQTYIQCPHGLGYMEPEAWQEPCISHPHDEILDFWLSAGVMGVAAYAWLQVAFWTTAVTLLRRQRDRAIVAGAAAAMLASLVHGAVDNSYFLPDLAILFWSLCALMGTRAAEIREAEFRGP